MSLILNGMTNRGGTLVILKQDTLRNCGQTCVAMLTDKPVNEVCAVVGKHRKQGTNGKDLIKGLRAFNVACSERSLRFKYGQELPTCALMRIQSIEKSKWSGHWVVLKDEYIYEPTEGKIHPIELFIHTMKEMGRHFTSYVEILEEIP